MDETSWFLSVIRAPATPLYIALLFMVAGGFRVWPSIMERINERKRDRAAIEADQYVRMDGRLKHLEEAESRCRDELADAVRRVAELEGYMMGTGKARQDAANIVAVERLTRDGEGK